MKILVISDLYPPFHIGGYELNCKDSVEALISRGHEITVLTSSWGLDRGLMQGKVYRLLDFDSSVLHNQSRIRLQKFAYFKDRLLQLRRLLISRRNYLITRKVVLTTQPDIVYIWHLGHLTVSPALAVQDSGLPACFRIEDYSLARIKQLASKKGSFLKKLYRSFVFGGRDIEKLHLNHFLFISQYVKQYYVQSGYPAAEMAVVPSGVPVCSLLDPVNRAEPFLPREGGIRLVFTGRVEPEKGPDIAIKAMAILKAEVSYPLVHLDIIGDGNLDFLGYLNQLTNDLSVSDRVSFLGRLSQSEVLGRLRYYDALLFTSRWEEPFGRVLIEAMAQGLPVIAARNGGVPEIINDSENGLLVPPDSPPDLADAINTLLRDPARATHLSHNAFITIRSRFTLEQTIDQMEDYLFSVVKTQKDEAYSGSS